MSLGESRESGTARSMTRRVRRVAEGRRPFVPFGLAPLLGLVALLLWAVFPFAKNVVEASAQRAAEAAASRIGADWATVTASGQRVTLEGVAPSQQACQQLADAIDRERGPTWLGGHSPVTRVVRRCNVNAEQTGAVATPAATPAPAAEPAQPAAAPDWTFTLRDGLLTLNGTVPDDAAREDILSEARSQISPPRITRVDDQLQMLGRGAPVGYVQVAQRGLRTLGQCDVGRTSFIDSYFSLRCELPSSRAATVEAQAFAQLPMGRMGSIEILPRETLDSCEQRLADILSVARIQFETSSSVISASSFGLLDTIAEAVAACPGRLRIGGHTDSRGGADYNRELSYQRAFAVRRALIQRGIESDRLVAQGYGESQPIADNATDEGRARNRRIEFRVIRTDP